MVSLLRFAFARQKRLDQPGDLAAFLSYWDDLDRREQEGLAESARVDADDEALDVDGDDEGGVVLITAHAAKGLEFDTVFVPKVSPALGYPSSRSQEPRLPATVLKELGADGDEQERRAAEERRLFYVACTRAERRLVMMGSIPKGKSTSTNYLLELTANQPKLEGLEQTDLETVVGGWRPAAESSVAKELLETKMRKDRDAKRDELAAQARRRRLRRSRRRSVPR
ncbi:MAG: 3'-5' exonuclease [Phycisphaerales bacterium]